MPLAYHRNVSGPFFVEAECCMTCGIPDEVAPDLFAWDTDKNGEGVHCFVRKQPKTDEELARMIDVMRQAEADCIYYGGSDERVRRLMRAGSVEEQCQEREEI